MIHIKKSTKVWDSSCAFSYNVIWNWTKSNHISLVGLNSFSVWWGVHLFYTEQCGAYVRVLSQLVFSQPPETALHAKPMERGCKASRMWPLQGSVSNQRAAYKEKKSTNISEVTLRHMLGGEWEKQTWRSTSTGVRSTGEKLSLHREEI